MYSVQAILNQATCALAVEVEKTAPRLAAEILLTHVTGWSRSQLLAWPERVLTPEIILLFNSLLKKRLQGEPVAYLRGWQPFWNLELQVTSATLIPRPETEHLIEQALERLDKKAILKVADLGTGCGAIAAALATERPNWQMLATEISAPALQVARKNFQIFKLKILLIQANWLNTFNNHCLDAIVSNPPYIPAQDQHLTHGDLRYEPRCALTPGDDGLDALKKICVDAVRVLRPGGILILEHGNTQGTAVRQLFMQSGFKQIETCLDLANLERLTLGTL